MIISTCLWCCAERRNSLGWGGRLAGKEGGLRNRPTSSGREGGGIFGIFQEPFQSGSRCIILIEQPVIDLGRTPKANITHHFPSSLVVKLLLEDGADDTHCPLMEHGVKKQRSRGGKKVMKTPPTC